MEAKIEPDALVKELRSCGETIIRIADTLTAMLSPEETQSEEPAAKPEELSFEEVRHRMTLVSQAGFSAQVRNIIAGYGVKKLSEIDPADYEELLRKAESLGNPEVSSDG